MIACPGIDGDAEQMTAAHDEIQRSPEMWAKQEYVGLQDGYGFCKTLELRNCNTCHSTLAIEIDTSSIAEVAR